MLRTIPSLLLAVALGASAAAPAVAGPAQTALLSRYAGTWTGSGKVTGTDPGTVQCRLTAKLTGSGKLGFNGRCSFSGGPAPASFTGTIAYNDATRAYEASSFAQGQSIAVVGRLSGSTLTFASAGTRTMMGMANSTMVLSPGSIRLSFKVTDRGGDTTASNVSFTRG